ncbi:MAG TPA: hypothetical protein PKN95_04655 [Verrucomicrobiota bacterium]|nr:hypothetical protein [Verrucomicrobiota bacterium]HNT14943.1 hypothetical protein [Verrucomicrobiota bacterium]
MRYYQLMTQRCRRGLLQTGLIWLAGLAFPLSAEPIHHITIDGDFSDWAGVPSHYDPVAGPGVLHHGIPDTHDTDHKLPGDIPAYVAHPDVDLVEFKFTHDQSNLYAYFRATGVIGRGSPEKGRYYVIVTLDVDNNETTGYALNEGGYYPTSSGYDMNMEVEYYRDQYNTGHYLNHGARNQAELDAAIQDQTNGIVRILPGSYKYYSQWVWFDSSSEGDFHLPPPDADSSITFVADKGPVYQGIIHIAHSADGHEVEMVAPFRGFMRDASGEPIVKLGKTLKLSFSLEASGELAPGGEWASDTGDPIVGYYLSPFTKPNLQIAPSLQDHHVVLSWDSGARGMVLKQTLTLTDPDWQVVNGSQITNRIELPATAASAFFRLEEP